MSFGLSKESPGKIMNKFIIKMGVHSLYVQFIYITQLDDKQSGIVFLR